MRLSARDDVLEVMVAVRVKPLARIAAHYHAAKPVRSVIPRQRMTDHSQSKPTPRSSFLEGTPRIPYGQLEFIEDEMYPDEGVCHHEGRPFTGVAWAESEGRLSEDSLKDGIRHGRCVRFHANGEFASDGSFEDDEAVGDFFEWYDSGVMKFHGVYDASERTSITWDYNEAGVMVREIDRSDGSVYRRLRHWTDQGELVYEDCGGVSTCYAPGSNWAIREQDRGPPEERPPPDYRDDLLYEHASSMLADGLAQYSVYRWLHLRLAENEPRAVKLLSQLVEHPDIEVVERSLNILENNHYEEAIPAVRRMTRSKLRKDPSAGGFRGPISDLAKLVLVNLTVEDEQERRVARGSVRHLRAIRERKEREREQERQERRQRVKRNWPKISADFRNSLMGEFTLKSGDQIFTDEVKERRIEYWHYYNYVIEGRTYSACVITENPQPEGAIVVRYRAKNPAEYDVD